MRIAAIALLAMLPGCAGGYATAGAPLPAGVFRAEDNVLLGNFSTVQAVASSYDRMYVVYPSAVGIRDPLAGRWLTPHRAPGYAALRGVFTALVDPLDRTLWLADQRQVIHFDPMMQRWDATQVPGGVRELAMDIAAPGTGVWVSTAAGWMAVPRVGPARAAAPPTTLRSAATLEDALEDIPALRAMAPAMLRGPGLVPVRLTSAAPVADGSGWYLGTDVIGLVKVDRVGVAMERMEFGLPGDQVGALLAVPGGVWVATDRDFGGAGAALTFIAEDLSRTIIDHGDAALATGVVAVRALAAGDRMLWLGTDRGVAVHRVDELHQAGWSFEHNLLPQQVSSLLPWNDGVLVGSDRGLAFIDALGEVSLPAREVIRPVHALHSRNDTVWVGTSRGLMMLARGDSGASDDTGWRRLVGSAAPVIGIGSVGDTLVAMTLDRIAYRNPLTGSWVAGISLGSSLGRLVAFHATEFGVWVGGERGAAFLDAAGMPRDQLRIGDELPDAVTAIAASPRHLWVGTLRGLVRLTLVPQ